MELQQNMILESIGNHNRARQIGEATFQALEKENKVKGATLGNIIDWKVSGSVRKFYSKATLQRSKLAKKVIDLEKLPNKALASWREFMREEAGRRQRFNKIEKRRGYSFNRKTKLQLVKRVIMVMTAEAALEKVEVSKVDITA